MGCFEIRLSYNHKNIMRATMRARYLGTFDFGEKHAHHLGGLAFAQDVYSY